MSWFCLLNYAVQWQGKAREAAARLESYSRAVQNGKLEANAKQAKELDAEHSHAEAKQVEVSH